MVSVFSSVRAAGAVGERHSMRTSHRVKDKLVTADDSETKRTENSDCSMEASLPSPHERQSRRSSRISFKNIEIREYARTVGDNPSCSSGPPMSLSWEYDKSRIISVDDYERRRPERRSQEEMTLPRNLRQEILNEEWRVPQSQIVAAVRETVKVKQQRRTTVNNLDKNFACRMEVFMESASRKVKRGLLLQKSVKKQAEDLERQSRRASLERSRASFQQQVGEESEEKSSEDMTGSSTSRVARVLTDEQDNVPSVASVRSSLNNNQALSTINAHPEQPRQESQPNPESALETNANISVRDSGSTLADI